MTTEPSYFLNLICYLFLIEEKCLGSLLPFGFIIEKTQKPLKGDNSWNHI